MPSNGAHTFCSICSTNGRRFRLTVHNAPSDAVKVCREMKNRKSKARKRARNKRMIGLVAVGCWSRFYSESVLLDRLSQPRTASQNRPLSSPPITVVSSVTVRTTETLGTPMPTPPSRSNTRRESPAGCHPPSSFESAYPNPRSRHGHGLHPVSTI